MWQKNKLNSTKTWRTIKVLIIHINYTEGYLAIEHRYYSKSKKQQQKIQFTIAGITLSTNLIILVFAVMFKIYLLPIIGIAVTISIIAPFYDVPALVRNGKLYYYSPMLLAEKVKNGIIKIHGGTLFDYVFCIDKNLNGNQRTNAILKSYIDGIINLINVYEFENTKNVKIRGTSYILNERTAEKIGFVKVKTNLMQRLILFFNYTNLLISLSLAKAKLTFPRLRSIYTFEGKLENISKNKAFLISLRDRIEAQIMKASKQYNGNVSIGARIRGKNNKHK